MEIKTLITMANQIGSFFKGHPDKKQASQDIVSHIMRFWAPHMRQEIKDYVSTSTKKDSLLDDLVFDAITKYLNK